MTSLPESDSWSVEQLLEAVERFRRPSSASFSAAWPLSKRPTAVQSRTKRR